MNPSRPAPPRQRGAMLLEALIAILVCAFGLLGFAGMQARATSAEFESYQRSQALVLIEDMASRLNANRAEASAYGGASLIGRDVSEPAVCPAGVSAAEPKLCNCAPLTGASLDLCEWGNLLRGSAETRNGVKVGAMFNARGCISKPVSATDRYVIAIAWQGINRTGAPASACGKDDEAFPTEPLRRVVSSVVCIGSLADPAVAPVTPRC